MPEHSPELRKLLVESLDVAKKEKDYENDLRYYRDEERERLNKNFEAQRQRLNLFKEKHQLLLERCSEMSEEEFEREYEAASIELEYIFNRVMLYLGESAEDRSYTVEFVDIDKVDSLDRFIESFPMQFVPKKEEIGRILGVAKQMHELRARLGEKGEQEPIRIVDIGGANGVLGKLITELAKENGLRIEYTIVDPDTKTVQAAKAFYQSNPALAFVEQTAESFNLEQYHDEAEIRGSLSSRKAIIDLGEKKKSELGKVLSKIRQLGYENSLRSAETEKYLKILINDFGLDIARSVSNGEELMSLVERESYDIDDKGRRGRSLSDLYAGEWEDSIKQLDRELESQIAKKPARYDLVINSWMPVRTDFTSQVREANGAAILYAVERYGATGCRSDAAYPERPTRLGEIESYNPGSAYESKFGWISHSVPQIANMGDKRRDRYWEYYDPQLPPFCNGFIVQTKNGYLLSELKTNPQDAGINIGSGYPWEDELLKRGGEISPTVKLRDKNGMLDFYGPFNDLANDLEEKEEQKAKGLVRRRATFSW